jgi:hypothetical protein
MYCTGLTRCGVGCCTAESLVRCVRFRVDDANVICTTEEEVSRSSAYLLLYQRADLEAVVQW